MSKKIKLESLLRAGKYLEYADILKALFDPKEEVTQKQLDRAIKNHLKREV